MATATKKCKVCGDEYEYCHTVRRVVGVFRWQDVACCPEHGSTYLARIEESRAEKQPMHKNSEVIQEVIDDIIDDEENELFEKDFSDDDAEESAIEK